jgi:hypothetical protein
MQPEIKRSKKRMARKAMLYKKKVFEVRNYELGTGVK